MATSLQWGNQYCKRPQVVKTLQEGGGSTCFPSPFLHLAQGQGEQVLFCNSRSVLLLDPEPDPLPRHKPTVGPPRSPGEISHRWWLLTALAVLSSELLFPASVLELAVVLPVLPEVAPRMLCCCPAACCLPSASVSDGVHPGKSSSVWGSFG